MAFDASSVLKPLRAIIRLIEPWAAGNTTLPSAPRARPVSWATMHNGASLVKWPRKYPTGSAPTLLPVAKLVDDVNQ